MLCERDSTNLEWIESFLFDMKKVAYVALINLRSITLTSSHCLSLFLLAKFTTQFSVLLFNYAFSIIFSDGSYCALLNYTLAFEQSCFSTISAAIATNRTNVRRPSAQPTVMPALILYNLFTSWLTDGCFNTISNGFINSFHFFLYACLVSFLLRQVPDQELDSLE